MSVQMQSLDDLAGSLNGSLVRPGDAGYDEARSVWNGMIDVRPVAIAQCESAADVGAAIAWGRAAGLEIAVRGGGHNVAGLATVDGGLVIDLSAMRSVTVDPETRLVTVGGGAELGDLDAATQEHGLAVPAGVVSETGVAGLTLSGGMGWLRRAHGLTCDNLVAVELVTADGEIVRADDTSDPDLMWGLRGGGGNFGVVTEFTFRAHPIGPEVAFVFALYPIADSRAAFEAHERIAAKDDRISPLFVLGHVPPLEDFPVEIHEQPFAAVLALYAGPADEGERVLAPLREIGPLMFDMSDRMQYVDVQKIYDPDYPAGHRYYWKSTNTGRLPGEAIDRLVERMLAAPSKHATIDVWLGGGAVAEVADDATAFSGRTVPYVVNPEANWEHEADDEANVAWARGVLDAIEEWSGDGLYLNFPGFLEEGQEVARAGHGSNYERLSELKRRFDPENVFRRNANIEPAEA